MGRSVRCGCQAPPGRPHDDRQRRLLYCRAVSLLREGDGEKRLQLQATVTRPWCGPGGYIQVGMRGCEPGGGVPRAVFVKEEGRSPPFGEQFSPSWGEEKRYFLLLSRLPPSGGRRPLGLVGFLFGLAWRALMGAGNNWRRRRLSLAMRFDSVVPGWWCSLVLGGWRSVVLVVLWSCGVLLGGGERVAMYVAARPPPSVWAWPKFGLAVVVVVPAVDRMARASLGALGEDANGRCGRVR